MVSLTDRQDMTLDVYRGRKTTIQQQLLVDSSTVICWRDPLSFLGCQVYFVAFILFLMENSVSKQCRS